MTAILWIVVFLAVWLALSLGMDGSPATDRMTLMAVVGLALAGTVLVYRNRKEQALLETLKRGAIVLWPILLATLLPIAVVLFSETIDVRLRQAILAGLVIVAGWLTTFVFQEERNKRNRVQMRRDVLVALENEIIAFTEKLDSQPIAAHADSVQDRIRKPAPAGRAYQPFATTESAPIVFEAVSGSISLLSEETLEPVLSFYAQYTDMRAMVVDSHSDELRSLPPERRVAFHRQLTERRKLTLRWGLRALVEIRRAQGHARPERLNRTGLNPGIEP